MAGARSRDEVDPAFIQLLEAGVAESRTHVEQMAMSHHRLLKRAFPTLAQMVPDLDAQPFIARFRTVGSLLASSASTARPEAPASWVSDTVRGWCAMAVVSADVAKTIHALLPYARDHHFAVREWAWLAARPLAVERTDEVIQGVIPLSLSDDPFDRRFAVELTRPRSVWGPHIGALKAEPERAIGLLDQLTCDPSSYVRKSVANWLNDASRSNPRWVEETTTCWTKRCSCPHTSWIVNSGLRSLRRTAAAGLGGLR
jgi:3-methyladenine DNA glycosylase AlkC